MRIISLLASVHPDRIDACQTQIIAMPGVQVHARIPPSRLALTVEDVDGSDPLDVTMAIQRLPGVLAVNLTYEYSDAPLRASVPSSPGHTPLETAR